MRYAKYESVAQKQAKCKKMIDKINKDGNIESLEYVMVKKSDAWWSKRWEENMESYADMSNRIARGKTYVKNGLVFDFNIQESLVTAKVVGTSSKPYKVEIKIKKLSSVAEKKLLDITKNKISSIESFLNGDFPLELENLLLDSEIGLFPSPDEISFDCNCPDGAYMCKHVAAVLFGISSKLSKNPLLFFTLRGIDVNKMIKKTIDKKVNDVLKNSKKKSDRTISESDAIDLFNL